MQTKQYQDNKSKGVNQLSVVLSFIAMTAFSFLYSFLVTAKVAAFIAEFVKLSVGT